MQELVSCVECWNTQLQTSCMVFVVTKIRLDMFINRFGFSRISKNNWWINPFLVVVYDLYDLVSWIIFFIGIIPCLSSFIGIDVIVMVTESCATFMLLSILIGIGVIVVMIDSSVTSMLARSLVSLVLSRDMSHGSVLFQIISSS